MEDYKKRLALAIAETGALFIDKNLVLKDGRPTPYFVNMGMFRTGRLSLELGSVFADMIVDKNLVSDIDIILGPSYKGSSIALATAVSVWKDHGIDLMFEYDRKEPKSHGEASTSKSMFVTGAFFEGCRIVIVDDVATSMKTKYDILGKIYKEADKRNIRCQVKALVIAVDREQTGPVYDRHNRLVLDSKGANAIQDFMSKTGVPVFSVAGIREIFNYLYTSKTPLLVNGTRKPINRETMENLNEYFELYGTD
jgi:orotate phosphoribosyltransferase